ncbi:MAG: aminoacyl-tRNA hydrolase [Dehalococcoidia bacterium]|nr:MAG: aminoacyl-tRNA hydrolase [Dehalococcoidia bacterium]
MEKTPPNVRLVVGLGNPGQAYAAHRHNVGFWCVRRLARDWSIPFKSSRWARLGEGQVDDHPLVLAKPRTFVNRSGDAAASLLQRYELSPQQMLVICDDLELPAGNIRLRPRGGDGGHNGLRDIIYAIESEDFPRLRIGIGRPRTAEGEPITHPLVVAKYVLGEPEPEEQEALEAAVERAAEAVACVLREGLAVAMNRYN